MKSGQTLVFLLVFVAMAVTVTSAAVVLMINNSQSSATFEQGLVAYDIAEGGAENAVLRLLRDPTYTGETLTIGTGQATITVTGTGPYTIVSKGVSGNFLRQVQVTVNYVSGILTASSWQEIF